MRRTAFDAGWQRLSTEPISPKWFKQLRAFYAVCDDAQVDEVRRHLGWAEEQCVDPPDAFGACFSERLKPDIRTHDAAIRSTEEFVLEDWTEYREQILSLVGFWHALVLAGYDPNALFRSATKKAGWRHKLIVRGVLWTTPLPGWSNWGYEIERDAVGRVNIFTTGL